MKDSTILPPSAHSAATYTLDASRTVNDTVLAYPQTLPVFAAHHMDTCCRGALTIEDAVKQEGVELNQLLTELDHVISSRTV